MLSVSGTFLSLVAEWLQSEGYGRSKLSQRILRLNPDAEIEIAQAEDYLAEAAGTYVVETTKLTPDVGPDCNYNPTEVEVVASIPQFEINFLTEVFEHNATVEIVTVDPGLGFYRFSLDNGPFQQFNRFYNVGPGTHTITVRDISGR